MEGRLPWRSDPRYHQGQAAHLRELAETATTPRAKAHLLRQAVEHERKARGAPTTAIRDEYPRRGKRVRF